MGVLDFFKKATSPLSRRFVSSTILITYSPTTATATNCRLPKNATSAIVLSAKIEAGSNSAARMELAKKRINAVRRALLSDGISPGRVRVEVAEYPAGRFPPREADIVEMNLR